MVPMIALFQKFYPPNKSFNSFLQNQLLIDLVCFVQSNHNQVPNNLPAPNKVSTLESIVKFLIFCLK